MTKNFVAFVGILADIGHMSKTIRKMPEWAQKVEWTCPKHKLTYMIRSGVRYLKGDRGDGIVPGWDEGDSPTQKRIGKRNANKVRRRAGRRMEKVCEE